MARPDERQFVTFRRGHVRDFVILATMRNSMRNLLNPDTNQLFTEDEIQRATQPGSRFYIEADAIDLYGQSAQARALFFSNQVRPDRAATGFLEKQHAGLWLEDGGRLPASGGSGLVDAPATVGTIFFGSTTLGDPSATTARDKNGTRYQVLTTTVTPSTGTATLIMQAIDPGIDSNPVSGTELSWINPPIGAEPEATVSEAFTGGFPIESNSELAKRVEDTIRFRPSSGNSSHFRSWARQASAAVENAFVYPTGASAGTVVVCIVQKRGTASGPLARFPSVGTLAAVTGFIVPPNSPVVPARALVIPTAFQPDESDIVLGLSLPVGTEGGWLDADPWPRVESTFDDVVNANKITAVTDQSNFTIRSEAELPGGVASISGVSVPNIMLWDEDSSRFERLFVNTITDNLDGTFDIVLRQAASTTLAVDQVISPYTDRNEAIALASEGFFDDLGPGQVVDSNLDTRITRASRFPATFVEAPDTAGANLTLRILEGLGNVVSNADVVNITRTEPELPVNVSDGPHMLILGKLVVTPL